MEVATTYLPGNRKSEGDKHRQNGDAYGCSGVDTDHDHRWTRRYACKYTHIL